MCSPLFFTVPVTFNLFARLGDVSKLKVFCFFYFFSIFCRAFGAKTGLAGVAKSTWPKQTQPRFMGRLNTRLGFVVAPLISGHLLRGAGVAEAEAAKGAGAVSSRGH